jgi:hypothetical protein
MDAVSHINLDNPLFQRPMQAINIVFAPVSGFLLIRRNIFQLLKLSTDHSSLIAVDETICALARILDPISVVTCVGSQRLGKSTLFALFHARESAVIGCNPGHILNEQVGNMNVFHHVRSTKFQT